VVRAIPAERRQRKSQREGPPWVRVVERLGFPGDPDAISRRSSGAIGCRSSFPDERSRRCRRCASPTRASSRSAPICATARS
jgi:hypothetical protein